MKQRILNILKKRKVLSLAILLVLVSSTTALTWMWLSNTIEDDVEVIDQPMTLTLVHGPDSIWRGTYPDGPVSRWNFRITVDFGVMTTCNFGVSMIWDEYNSTEDYTGLAYCSFNGTYWREFDNSGYDLYKNSGIAGPNGEFPYEWQAGDYMWFTLDIIIDTTMPLGNYHFEFGVIGNLV